MSRDPQGAGATLAELLKSPHVTSPTRQVLEERLEARHEPRALQADEFSRLQAVARRLVPPDPALFVPGEPDLAGAVDHRLASGLGDGWRYDDTPPDLEALKELLDVLPVDFVNQPSEGQDAHLRRLQERLPHAFEDLLAELTEVYYSHPLVQVSLGVAPFADAPGWTRIGLDEREEWEPQVGGAAPSPERHG
ncbi:hypothetical protein [Deinococcus koreensis]|uniref:Gluconate 2-dehydrogenase subunit 3 family protein n=1 Tax=Deinococcus koreensis TaxID=2054903 RepID=A0A2K3USK9_9DEIO|nr:hypothetical protein [Deinococcus koreensis]PNY79523.1 hypothetical protein CVO96_19035 [Deinococcus koreensis]